jgi:hypothetical protein
MLYLTKIAGENGNFTGLFSGIVTFLKEKRR